MIRPLLLDMFCGAGGAAVGYHRAGFEVVGVDIHPQPRYPFSFIREDALEYAARYGSGFDAVHASPPCQSYSAMQATNKSRGRKPRFCGMIPDVQGVLRSTALPWVIENVVRSDLEPTVILCGTMFGLRVKGYELRRHRLFKCSFPVPMPGECDHRSQSVFVSTSGAKHNHWNKSRMEKNWTVPVPGRVARELMNVDWMNEFELGESIPPAYTEYIGRFLMAEVLRRKGLETAGKGG